MRTIFNNFCNSCTNIGCQFQSGIARVECAYMSPHTEPDNCGNYIVTQPTPTVEVIPKADIQKALKEGSKDISENVLAIVREEYISKADYETHLKSDMIAMLEELQLEITELPVHVVTNIGSLIRMDIAPSAEDVSDLIQEKINELKLKK